MVKVAALYKFVLVDDTEALRKILLNLTKKLKGTLIIGKEGLNGTIAGATENIAEFITKLHEIPCFASGLELKCSFTQEVPFLRMKVKIKEEIVTMKAGTIDPVCYRGKYVAPRDWNELITREDAIVIDTRNDYEYEIGRFTGALNPNTQTFREFPAFVEKHLKDKKVPIPMYCTGGIRCEKSTAYLNMLGFINVYHLHGGILKYLEEIPEAESLWEGECFVFDERVSVIHGLKQGRYDQCFACRYPVSEKDKLSVHYKKGESCPRCYLRQTEKNKQRARERQKQMELARVGNYKHLGRDTSMEQEDSVS